MRAPVVRAIYDWYLGGGVGLLQIRDRLNADPDRYRRRSRSTRRPPAARGAAQASGRCCATRSTPATRSGTAGHERRATTGPTRPRRGSGPRSRPTRRSSAARSTTRSRHARKANERSRQGVPATVARPTAKRDYLYRGLLRCGICGLRMWGNHRRHSTYYSCQPSHQRSKDIPADHPPHVYLNEQRLNDALFPFLATALFGPERTDYWRTLPRSRGRARARRPGEGARRGDRSRDRRPRTAPHPPARQPRSRRRHRRAPPARRRACGRAGRRHRRTARAAGGTRPRLGDRGAHVGRRRPVARPAADPRHLARHGAPGRTAGAVRRAPARRSSTSRATAPSMSRSPSTIAASEPTQPAAQVRAEDWLAPPGGFEPP